MKKRAGKIKEVPDIAKSKGFSEDDLSRIRFLFVALLVLSVGFYMLKDFPDISVGKAYSAVFRGEEFADSVEINLLANVPEIIELTVDNVVKTAQLEFTGSESELIMDIGGTVVSSIRRLSNEGVNVDVFDVASEINDYCLDYPCTAPLYITSKADGAVALKGINIEAGELEEIAEEVEKADGQIPILVLKYFPLDESGTKLDPEITGMNDDLNIIREKVGTLTIEGIDALRKGSTYRGYKDADATPFLDYSISGSKEFLTKIPLSDNLAWGKEGVFRPDYFGILTDLDICDYVDNQGVRQVWMWGYHFGDTEPDESNMAMGTNSKDFWNFDDYGDVSNSQRIDDMPICENTYTLYNYNYERGLGEMLEDHGHHIEHVLNWVDGRIESYEPGHDEQDWSKLLFWGNVVGSDKSHKIIKPGCGWMHFPPNGADVYDWYNEEPVLSDCEDWKPDGSGTKKDIDCHTWAGDTCEEDGGAAYKIWWMQNIPGKDNELFYNGKKLRNWLEFVADFDEALKKGKSLVFEEAEPTQCQTSLDCPIYNKCDNGVCVNFCGGKTLDAGSIAESSKEASQSAIQKLNNLGYDVVGNADLSGFEIQKSGNKVIFSSETQFDVFDQQFDSFVFVDKNGNTANIQKRQSNVQKTKPKATYIVELLDKPLLEEKSELEKKLEMQKASPQTIKEKIEKQLKSHEQRLKDAKAKALEEMLEVNADIESKIIDEYKSVFNGFSADLTEQEALELKEISSVKNVYRNEEVKALLGESVNQISADELWKLKDDNGNLITGKGVTIGIIDTGVDYTHDDLGGCLGKNCKVISGYDFVNNDNDPMDDQGHGTHVAATAAGNGILKGVAPDANIVAYKVLDSDGGGYEDDIIAAIERSVDPNQDGDFSDHLDVISMSLGGWGNPDDPMSKAIDNAVEEGIIAVIAAGNDGPYEQSIGSPGTARKAITVGAAYKCDSIAGFSSRGPVIWENGILLKPDLAAPGVAICAAEFDDWLPPWFQCKDDKHIAISGTSMATPHVSGAAALLLQAHPEWTPETIKSTLMSTSLDLGLSPIEQGAGRINVLEANNAEIAINPQSISFSFKIGELKHEEAITVKNLEDKAIKVIPKVAELKDDKGVLYNFASFNLSESTIEANSQEDIGFIVDVSNNVEGVFEGLIIISYNREDYRLPFIFDKLSKLTLKATSKETKLYPSFGIHNNNLDIVKGASNGFDFGEDTFTFRIPSDTYTAYAMGDFNSELDYILSDMIKVPFDSEVSSELKIEDARPFNVKAESLQGTPLKFYEWNTGFNTYDEDKLVGSFHYSAIGNGIIYLSNKPDNGLDMDVFIFFNGIPAIEGDLVGKSYITAEEQYAAGWMLHNIDEETPTSLDYSKEDFAIYNYSYNFPASQPDSFGNVVSWIKPRHVNDSNFSSFLPIIFSPIIRLGVPLDRTYYIMGQNPNSKYYSAGWSFSNYVLGYSSKYIEEHYLSENQLDAIESKPGEKKSIAFGRAPYTPASLIVKDNRIRLNGHVLRGYDNNSYLIGYEDPKPPRYEVFVNDVIKAEDYLTKWDPLWESEIWSHEDLDYTISEDGKYKVKLFIETDYPIWDDVIIESSFTVPSDDTQPPELQHIEANPYFIAGEEYDIVVDLHDESGIEKVEMSATTEFETDDSQTGGIGVVLVPELIDAENQIYEASFTPGEEFNYFDLAFTATDTNGNSIIYKIKPVALPAQSIKFNLKADKDVASNGDKITLEGECETDDGPCDTFLIRYYANNEFLKTYATSYWDGSFGLEWEVPWEYDADEINFTVKYDGTGIYLPNEEAISIPLQTFDEDIGIFDLKTTDPVIGEPINVSAAVKNLGSSDAHNMIIEFKVNKKVLGIKMIPFIQAKKGEVVEFEWQPIRENSYSIELEAIAENDEDLSNNFLEKELEISYIAPDITGFIEEPEKIIIDLESDISFSIFNNGEEKAKDLEAAFYAFYKPQNTFLFFPGEEGESEEGEVIVTPEPPVEEPIEQPANTQDKEEKEKEKEKPSEEPSEEEPSSPGGGSGGGGGGGGGSTKPEERPISTGSVDYNGTTYNFLAFAERFNLALNVSTEKFNETINFTYNERIKKLQNDIYIFADFFSESSVLLTVGNASLIKKDLDELEPAALRVETIKWAPTLKGEHFLLVFVNTSIDSNFESNYFGSYVKVLRTGVNIQAEFMIDYEKTFVAGNETNITVRITNLGTEEAKNIRIALFEQKIEEVEEDIIPKIKKKEIGSKKLDRLGQGKNEELRFSWTPSKPGENFLLLIAEAKGDINPEDNDDNAFIDVISESADITSYFDWITRSKLYSESIFANEEQQLITTISDRGKSDANNVSLSLYETIDKETRLVEKKEIGTLKPKVESNVEFNWTPSKNGRVELKLEGLASNDDNQENNNDSIIVDVLVKDVDVKVTLESYPGFILAGKNNPIWVSLQNFGSEDAPAFSLTLKASEQEVDSVAFEGLDSGLGTIFTLNWQPENDGNFEIKAEINLTDADLSNNNDTDAVKVFKTKEIRLRFVDKDGNNVERALLLGDQETLVNEPVILKIPDTKLKMWIGAIGDNDQVAASIYSNTIIENTSITSAHLNEPVTQEGLLLYEIFANNDSWDYEAFSSFFSRRIDTLNIRYTELEAFYCTDYNFSNNVCKEWKDIPLETLVSAGDLLVSIDTAKATAIALGDKDYDNDNAPDWDDSDSDNDGIDDEDDTFTCFDGRLKSREEFNITVNESSDTGKQIKGKNKVGIKDKGKKIVEFNANFDNDKLDCREIAVEKQPEVTTRGFILIKGISLTNETKTAYVDKIAAFNRVCVKDEEVDSINELSQNCDGSNEFLVMCDSVKHGNYTCTDLGTQYKVEGLLHSAIAEPTSCQESWSCTDWSSCKNDKQTRACTDTNACGTSFNKPSEKRSCDEDEEKEEDKGLSGSLSRNTFDLGEIKSWSDGKSRTLKLGEKDLIIFTFDNKLRSIELEQIKGARISIKPSWSGKSIDLTTGETKAFDIDNDKKDDIKFKFETISRDKATVVIERIIGDARVTAPTKAQPQPTGKEDDLRKGSEKAEAPSVAAEAKDKGSIATAIALVSFFAILSVLIGLIIYKRDEIMEFISEKSRSKEAKPLSEYDKVKSYILNELNSGFTMEQIKEKLEEVGWQKELIELVMRDIKKKR